MLSMSKYSLVFFAHCRALCTAVVIETYGEVLIFLDMQKGTGKY